MRWYHWLWTVPIALITGVVAYFLGKRRGDLATVADTELEIVEARAKAQRLMLEKNAEHARKWIGKNYRGEMQRLDDEAKKRTIELRDDPPALAEYIIRTARGCSVEEE